MIHRIKGVNDVLPGEVETWQRIEAAARRFFAAFGYDEIKLPIFEDTELFARSIGETTDIVEKEMYTFLDRNGKKITLRPEGTASAIRAFIEHRLDTARPLTRLFYLGPMFRHERPQAGRFRQFYQIGAEAIGSPSPHLDVEILSWLRLFFEDLGLGDLRLEINSLGCPLCRPRYKQALTAFLKSIRDRLCEDCRRRMDTNPLRVLDCKVEECRRATADAPAVTEMLGEECSSHFAAVTAGLAKLGIDFILNPRLVRGLDYYTKTAFEWTTDRLGSQNAIAAGGRYDALVKELGGPDLPAIGFAAGIERMAALIGTEARPSPRPLAYVCALGEEPLERILPIVFECRRKNVRVDPDYDGGSLKSQMKRADRSGARFAVIIGEDELRKGTTLVRDLASKAQREIPLGDLTAFLAEAATSDE